MLPIHNTLVRRDKRPPTGMSHVLLTKYVKCIALQRVAYLFGSPPMCHSDRIRRYSSIWKQPHAWTRYVDRLAPVIGFF